MGHINNAVVALADATEDGGIDIYCTGTFIGDNAILTAAHCVAEGETELKFLTYSKYRRSSTGHPPASSLSPAHVRRVDVDKDLALLIVPVGTVVGPHTFLPVADSGPAQGENVYLVGHPVGIAWTLTVGVVSYERRPGWPGAEYEGFRPVYIQHDAQAWPGNSGGPLVNYDNELCGVLVQGIRQASYLSMSVHTEHVHNFLAGV
jgi:S1-C subfamily serine protease